MSTFSQQWQSLEVYGIGLVGLEGTRKLVGNVLRDILNRFDRETQTLAQLQDMVITQTYNRFSMVQAQPPLPPRRPGDPKVEVDILRHVATVGTLEDMHKALLTNGREYQSFGNTFSTGTRQFGTQAPTTGVAQAQAVTGSMSRGHITQRPMTQMLTPHTVNKVVQRPAPSATRTQPGYPGPASETFKINAPRIEGAGDWEITFSKSINIITYIDPYKRSLEALLGVHLNIKYEEKPPRLFIGDTLWRPYEAPDMLQSLVNCERRVKAWEDLMQYVRDCDVRKKGQDIMKFMIARKSNQVRANLQSAQKLVRRASKSWISGVKTGLPPTPTGTYREYDARARAAAAPYAGQI